MEFVVIGTSLGGCDTNTVTIGETYETSPPYQVNFKKNEQNQIFKGVNANKDVRYTVL